MRRHVAGLTLVEALVLVGVLLLVVAFVVGLLLPGLERSRSCARPANCSNNLANIIKCCQLYADAVPNLGMFPMYGNDPHKNGLKSLNLLYDSYVKDHRVFGCPDAQRDHGIQQNTHLIGKVLPPQVGANMDSSHTAYGYDPGHKPTDARAGVVADMSDDPRQNSANHGKGRPGQYVAIGSGSVEWLKSPTRLRSSLSPEVQTDDRLYLPDGLPPDEETFIIQ